MHWNMQSSSPTRTLSKCWLISAGNYFSRIGKTGIIDALREIKGDTAPAWDKMKKGELAALAERHTTATTWLPALLRGPAPALQQAA
jgi:hypothetical protein